jgi:hypothetical protein
MESTRRKPICAARSDRPGWTRLVAAALVAAPLVLVMGAAGSDIEDGWRIVRDPVVQLQISVPAGWSVTPGCHGRRTCLALSRGPAARDDYLIALEAFAGGLDQVAADHAIFRRTDAGWETTGRTDSQPVQTIDGPGWQGIRTVVPCDVADQLGQHSAAGECLWAVLSDGRRAVVADTLGTVPIDADINRVIGSVRFLVQ